MIFLLTHPKESSKVNENAEENGGILIFLLGIPYVCLNPYGNFLNGVHNHNNIKAVSISCLVIQNVTPP